MRPVLMSTLLLTMLAAVCRADEPVTLKLLPPADIGTQVLQAKGPEGQRAVEVIAGPERSKITLVAADAPENIPAHFVLRGKMKCNGVVDSGMLSLTCEVVGDKGQRAVTRWCGLTGGGDWHDFDIYFGAGNQPEFDYPGKIKGVQLDLALPGACSVTVAEPLVLAPIVKVGDRWEPEEPIGKLALRAAEEVASRIGTASGPAGQPAIEVVGGPKPSTYKVALRELPRISSPDYVLRGRVKCENVVGDGYLELLNDFGAHGTYFTRSLAAGGPMKKLTGTSDWRDFELPFQAQPGMKPDSLTLKVVLPGAGVVTVAEPLTVGPLEVAGQWWTERQSGFVGAGLGVSVGMLGALLGVSAAWGKLRRLTISLCILGIVIGGIGLCAGLVALCVGQPWHVYYPLLLTGLIGAGVFGVNLPQIIRRSRADELRRMTAADVV